MTKTFEFRVLYFKPSGKFYTEDKFPLDVTTVGPPGHPSPYMYEVCDRVRQWRSEGKLPGLSSGKWDGYVLVDGDEGYPCLILPEGL